MPKVFSRTATSGQIPPTYGAIIAINLVGVDSLPISGAHTATQTFIQGETIVTPDALGYWEVDLVANDLIEPLGTVYLIETRIVRGEAPADFDDLATISVPDAAGPFWVGDILTDPPSSLPSAALADEIARAMAAESGLQTNINTEATTRANADSALSTSLAQEITDRQSADARVFFPTAATAAALQVAIDAANAAGGGTVVTGAYTTYSGGLTQIPGQSFFAAMIWMRENVKLRFAKGAVLRLDNGVTLPGSTSQGLMIGSYSASAQKGIVLEDVVCDGNAANNQSHGVNMGAGIQFHYDLAPKAVRCKVFNLYGNLPGPPGESFHFDADTCIGASFDDCEADGGGVDTATGFSTNDSFGTSWKNCIAHDMQHGQGFTCWQSSGLRYSGCYAYSCGANGFNAERSEGIAYAACVSGGRTPYLDGDNPLPGYTDNQTVGNQNGFVSSGCTNVDYAACVGSYNVVGFSAVANTAKSPTLNNTHVVFRGTLNNNTANVVIDSTQDSVYCENYADSGTSDSRRTSAVAPLDNYLALNGGSGLRQAVSGYSSFVYRLQADGFACFTVVGGTDPSLGGTDNTGQAGDALFPFNVKGESVTTKYLTSAGKTSIAAADFAHRPGDGSFAIAKDSTTGITRLFAKVDGVWVGLVGATATDALAMVSAAFTGEVTASRHGNIPGLQAQFGTDDNHTAALMTNGLARVIIEAAGGMTMQAGNKFATAASATGGASLNVPAGTAPTSPADGDVWETTAGVFARVNGATVGPLTDTAYVDGKVIDSIADSDTTHAPSRNSVFDALALKAPFDSPAFTGNPTAPTASPGDNDTSIATTAFVTAAIAANAAYHYIATGRARFDAQTAITTSLNESQSNSPSGSGGGGSVFYFDPADYPSGATLRVVGIAVTNDTAPSASFTFGLYPIGTPSGGAAAVAAPFGTVVSGSTAAITTPSADTKNHAASSDFAAPAAGYYALGVVVSANMAANSSAAVRATLQVKYS